MIFRQIPVGGDRNFAYLVGDEATREAAVVDAAYNVGAILKAAEEEGLRIIYAISTHDHHDHTNGNRTVKARTGAKIVMHRLAAGRDVAVDDGDVLRLGSLEFRFIHTPGHTRDAMCVLVGGRLLTGDTLFVGKVGGTGYGDDARREYESLHRKILALPDETEVWPGHDVGVRPSSTVGEERRTNPFLLRESFEAFLDLKRNWLQYKREHGIA